MARRAVAKESAKCLSGRACERVTATGAFGRGGKMPHTFGDDERIAAENDRDVVVPSREGTALEVIQPQAPL